MSTELVFPAAAEPIQPDFAVSGATGSPASPALDLYLVCLGRLTGESRRAMAGCLDRLARQAASGEQPGTNAAVRPGSPEHQQITELGFPWAEVQQPNPRASSGPDR